MSPLTSLLDQIDILGAFSIRIGFPPFVATLI